MVQQRSRAEAGARDVGSGVSPNLAIKHAVGPQVLLLLAGLAAVIGPFLPWLSIPADIGHRSQNGFTYATGLAWSALVVGAIVVVLAVRALVWRRRATLGEVVGILVLGVLLGAIAAAGLDQVQRHVANGQGSGLTVLLCAAAALCLDSIWQGFAIGRGRLVLLLDGSCLGFGLIVLIVLALAPAGGPRPSLTPVPAASLQSGASTAPSP